jgi:hypothetical protein
LPITQVEHARPVLKRVPAVRIESARVFEGKAERRASGAQRQVNSGRAGVRCGLPDTRVDSPTGAHQGAIHINADESDQGIRYSRVR